MKRLLKIFAIALTAMFVLVSINGSAQNTSTKTLLKNATLIDGNGGKPLQNIDILIDGETISEIGTNLSASGAKLVNLKGKTVMPALISAHVHVGVIKGNEGGAKFYTRQNIISQLKKYQDYGIGTVLAMGTDRPLLFETGLRDSSVRGLLPGARLYSAGYGFNVPDPTVSHDYFLGNLYRPASVAEVPLMMEQLAKLKPEVVKLWVDGKMKPEVYQAILQEAHKHNIRGLAHVFYLSDARKLVASGIDIFGHSIRDSVVDNALVEQMKARNIPYIPTLTLDLFAHAYAGKPYWLNDKFFKKSLEPGVYEMLSSEKYHNDQKASSASARAAAAFQIAMKNVKKLHDAGVMIALGTDSGSFPYRPQGFAEHLELEMLVKAGLTPLQAITIATRNAARVLRIEKSFGTLEKGKVADLIILGSNPVENIKNTRDIEGVYKGGMVVSRGQK
ncbi:amidohydrolase family protein [Daejeonella lutea]|uniref:Imidazolonepropionase n=1 Tax=Daejeonella lutea TaxID=572036 RepID=A0A1T5EAQ1_9SPHI|nr:amidohydrolase family protein [Daejeonella lutea]SKB81098.1 Imidazolonepropionase [Daejeonella lutea]